MPWLVGGGVAPWFLSRTNGSTWREIHEARAIALAESSVLTVAQVEQAF